MRESSRTRITKFILPGILVVGFMAYLPSMASSGVFPTMYSKEVKVPHSSTQSQTAAIPPIMDKIGYCESKNKQFNDDGTVLLGVNPDDVGRLQINTRIWGKIAKRLGYDIYTWEGNTLFGLWLFNNYGTEPWVYSKPCWQQLRG